MSRPKKWFHPPERHGDFYFNKTSDKITAICRVLVLFCTFKPLWQVATNKKLPFSETQADAQKTCQIWFTKPIYYDHISNINVHKAC